MLRLVAPYKKPQEECPHRLPLSLKRPSWRWRPSLLSCTDGGKQASWACLFALPVPARSVMAFGVWLIEWPTNQPTMIWSPRRRQRELCRCRSWPQISPQSCSSAVKSSSPLADITVATLLQISTYNLQSPHWIFFFGQKSLSLCTGT